VEYLNIETIEQFAADCDLLPSDNLITFSYYVSEAIVFKLKRLNELKQKADLFTNDLDFKNWPDFAEYSDLLDIF
jgi:hypothetical protein